MQLMFLTDCLFRSLRCVFPRRRRRVCVGSWQWARVWRTAKQFDLPRRPHWRQSDPQLPGPSQPSSLLQVPDQSYTTGSYNFCHLRNFIQEPRRAKIETKQHGITAETLHSVSTLTSPTVAPGSRLFDWSCCSSDLSFTSDVKAET